MGSCLTCNYYQAGECLKIAPVYIGYNPDSDFCQNCQTPPIFPAGDYDCQIIFDYYQSMENVSCNECPKKDSCNYKVQNCDGRLTDICFKSAHNIKMIEQETQSEADPDVMEIAEIPIEVTDVVNECERFCDVDKCKPCPHILSRLCEGPQSGVCQDCPRQLNCGPCPHAYQRTSIPELCDNGAGTIIINEEAMLEAGLTINRSSGSGAIKIGGGIEPTPIEPPINEDPLDGNLYACDDYAENAEEEISVVEQQPELPIAAPIPKPMDN